MKDVRKTEIIVLGMCLMSFIIDSILYARMPDKLAVYWNSQGQVNGYMPKFWGLFVIPFMLTGLALIFIVIPRIDPLKANIDKFRKYYDRFVLIVFIFILFMDLHSIFWSMGIKINPNIIISIGLGILFFYSGILCEHSKRNWFIGIRTPWTLSSDKVWDKTHRIGGKLFKIAGVIAFLGIVFKNYAIYFILVPVVLVTIYTVVYSYFEYRKEVK